MAKKVYFHIEQKMLKNDKIFPFHLYIYNPHNNTYTPFLRANSPLTKPKSAFLNHLVKKGAIISINEKQKLTFTRSMQIKSDQIQSHSVEEERSTKGVSGNNENSLHSEAQNKLKEKLKKEKFIPSEEVSKAISDNNFTKLIERSRDEIMCFDLRRNHTLSLASHLAEKLLVSDTSLNRVVALSWFFSKILGINDEDTQATLVCSAYFSHLGMTQVPIMLSKVSLEEQTTEGTDLYKKHQNLSTHILKKSKVELIPRTLEVIKDHHERLSGKGHPHGKSGDQIDQLSLIIGLVAEFIDQVDGKVDANAQGLVDSCNVFEQNKDALVVDFGEDLYENFLGLFKTGTFKAAA
ncbi:MAG: hypothetical protein KC493_01125 [Bacteriovoracaceae bacterium]|nr:hypothetical protein [Bacteriovoracaceae bacterium]